MQLKPEWFEDLWLELCGSEQSGEEDYGTELRR
jgi:hypothetical protein